jgi:uncharacterized membrane protein YfcA
VSPLHALAIFAAGIVAGTINTVVGSGTLFTFPVLLAFGYAPVVANVSNTVGLVPGSASGAWGYRRELAGQRQRLLRLGTASLLGGVTGGVLLLVLPAGAFEAIVPALIALGVVLVVLGPRISRWVDAHHGEAGAHGRWWVWPAVLATGVYGGYFGAAQGVLLMAVLGIGLADSMQRLNGTKNVLAGVVNLVAGLIFVVVADVDWGVAGLIAGGSIIGGLLGSWVGRRLPAPVLRGIIVAVGVVALAAMLLR